MKANPEFQNQPNEFWACIKLINQKLNYSSDGKVTVPAPEEVKVLFDELSLDTTKLFTKKGNLTEFGKNLFKYFQYRADVLNNEVSKLLMDVEEAKALYQKLHKKYSPTCKIPLNKQKGEKRAPAYFTGIINMLIERHVKGAATVYDPRQITAFTNNNFPARSLSRRVDGSFPHEINPIALWEIKEYYYTTTFGSRIADGVYETMLDGYELKDVRSIVQRDVFHYLMIDSRRTWWEMGKPYLCRIIDMLHMGLITECLFGKEVVQRIPELVKEWMEVYKKHASEFKVDGTQFEITLSDPE
jgi:hypothetical protein